MLPRACQPRLSSWHPPPAPAGKRHWSHWNWLDSCSGTLRPHLPRPIFWRSGSLKITFWIFQYIVCHPEGASLATEWSPAPGYLRDGERGGRKINLSSWILDNLFRDKDDIKDINQKMQNHKHDWNNHRIQPIVKAQRIKLGFDFDTGIYFWQTQDYLFFFRSTLFIKATSISLLSSAPLQRSEA